MLSGIDCIPDNWPGLRHAKVQFTTYALYWWITQVEHIIDSAKPGTVKEAYNTSPNPRMPECQNARMGYQLGLKLKWGSGR